MSYTDEQSQFLVDAWQAGHISVSAELERALSEAMANVQLRQSAFFSTSTPSETSRPLSKVHTSSTASPDDRSSSSRSSKLSSQARQSPSSSRSTPEQKSRGGEASSRSPVPSEVKKPFSRKASVTRNPDGTGGEGADRKRERSAPQLKKLKTFQLEAMVFNEKPLPATPDEVKLSPVELFSASHKHTRSASSGRILPSPRHTNEQSSSHGKGSHFIRQSTIQALRPVDGNLATLGLLAQLPPSTPKADKNLDSHKRDNHKDPSLQRTDSVIALQTPEQTCWKRTAYLPGEIKLQKPGMQRPDSSIGFGTNGTVAGFDLFKDLHDEKSSGRTRRSEIGVIDDVLAFMDSYGFDPVHFDHDEFWKDPGLDTLDLFDCHSPSSSRYSPTTPHSTQGWSIAVQSPISPSRRLSNSVFSKHAHAASVSQYSDRGRDSWSLYNNGVGSRQFPSSPSPPLPPPKSSTERGRVVGARPSPRNGNQGRIGMMRLLKGAGSIV